MKTTSSILQRTRCKCSQHNQKRNALQIEKTPAKRTRCKCSQHNQKRNALQIEKNTYKLRKRFRQFDNAHAANAHNTTKKETRCK